MHRSAKDDLGRRGTLAPERSMRASSYFLKVLTEKLLMLFWASLANQARTGVLQAREPLRMVLICGSIENGELGERRHREWEPKPEPTHI